MTQQPLRRTLRVLASLCLILLFGTSASAEWSHDPAANTRLSSSNSCSDVQAISDGVNGYRVFWVDGGDFHVQHVDRDGDIQWASDGKELLVSGEWMGDPRVVRQTFGDFYLAWIEPSVTGELVMVQRYDNNGEPVWADPGVRAQQWVINGTIQSEVQLVSDQAGGVIVAWINDPEGDAEIYAQRLDSGGNRLWASGVVAGNSIPKSNLQSVAGRYAGEAIFVWEEETAVDNIDIRGQLLDSSGAPQWDDTESSVAWASGDQVDPVIALAASGQCIIAWVDQAGTGNRVFYQRKFSGGPNGWSSSQGNQWDGFYAEQESPQITRNSDGDVYLICHDHSDSGGGRIAAQYFPASEYPWWGDSGRTLYEDPQRTMGRIALVADDQTDGFFAVWEESKYGSVYHAQRINSYGQLMWSEDRDPMAFAQFLYNADQIILLPGVNSGMAAFWPGKSLTSDPYYVLTGQYIDSHGYLGVNTFPLESVADRPNDQGGEVALTWTACPQDTYPQRNIAHYSMWIRGLSKAAAPVESMRSDAEIAELLQMSEAAVADLKTTGWTFGGQVPAISALEYTAFCPTYGDSTAEGITTTEFKVYAHHQDSGVSWQSNGFLTGYSVDNLAPGAPGNLAAQLDAGGVDLSWTASGLRDEDLAGYRIYRGSESGFALDPGSLLDFSPSESFHDAAAAGTVHYRVTAVDAHGNESEPSGEVVVTGATATGALPDVFAHRGNYPNPFNPMTRIAFDLPRADHVRVVIYDAAGRLVRTLVDAGMAAGEQSVRWNGMDDTGSSVSSGVYFSLVETGEMRATRRMTLLR